MTFLDLEPTAARTGLIASRFGNDHRQFCVLLGQDLHDLCARESPPDQADHDLHGSIDMVKKSLVAFAQVIQPRLAIWRSQESIFGTLPMAGKADVAFPAIARQRIQLVLPKLKLFIRADEIDHVVLLDVAEQVLGLDKMVARVQVAVMLEGQSVTASRVKDSHARGGHA